MFNTQRYLNRLHLAMASHITSNGFIIESLVTNWEDEFETLKPLFARTETDLSRFLLLASQAEIQAYYFTFESGKPGPNVGVNMARALGTARGLILTALALERESLFLSHAPQWAFRSVFDASCLLISSLVSNSPPWLPEPTAEDEDPAQTLVNNCVAAISACSVRDGDLPSRGASLVQGFWQARDVVPPCDLPAMAWPNRLGAGITFWCLNRFNRGLHEAQRTSESAAKTLKAVRKFTPPHFPYFLAIPTLPLLLPRVDVGSCVHLQNSAPTEPPHQNLASTDRARRLAARRDPQVPRHCHRIPFRRWTGPCSWTTLAGVGVIPFSWGCQHDRVTVCHV